jgi:peptidyl-prolyl cis-trans isomerase C
MPEGIASQISSATSSGDTSTVAALRTQGLAQIQSKAEEVLAKVQNGGDFDALMAQYGEDPGMKADPSKTTGYQVGAKSSFVAEFLSAAMGLANVGDTTQLVASDYGYHIIKYAGNVPAGAIALADVKEGLRATVLQSKQSDAFSTLIGQWTKEMGVKTNAGKIPS